tara:strand:+ start:43 stop:930 length:888 start_codon:yes stop_codon:yes gene_type:complete
MAPAVLVLGSMVVRVTSALIKKQLMKYGFKVASDYKKYSNVTNVTTKNSSRVLDNAKKLGQKLGKIKPTPTSPGGGKAVKLTDAMKKTARNAQKVSGKEFGKRKLSEFGRVSTKPATTKLSPGSSSRTVITKKPKPSAAKLKSKKTGLTGVVIPLALTSSSTKDSSAPSVKNSNARVSDPPGKNPSTDPGVLNIVRIAKEALGEKKAPPAAVVKQVVKEVPKKDKYKNQTTPAEKEALRKMEAAAVKKQLSAFGKKFKSERAKGEYSFPFKGKEYTTRYKEESVAEHKKKFPKKK